jgi:hypothetical protein
MSAPIMSNSVAGGPSEPNKYSVDDSGVEIATGDPAAGGLYLPGLARRRRPTAGDPAIPDASALAIWPRAG